MSRQAERSEATRAKLIRAARELFRSRGYAGVGTEEIVRRARVTRGALYHHFDGKRDLFRAVYEQVEDELTQTVGARLGGRGSEDPVAAMVAGMGTFLDACTDHEVQRVALIDAPAVLGWSEWRRIGEERGLGLVVAALGMGMEAGSLRRQPVRPLAHVLLAAMTEAGLMIANAEDPAAARAEVERSLRSILEGLRA